MVVMWRCRRLRLRRDRSRETENNNEPEEKLFHSQFDADSAGRFT